MYKFHNSYFVFFVILGNFVYVVYFIIVYLFTRDTYIYLNNPGTNSYERGSFNIKHPNKSQKNGQYEKCSHFWYIF